MLTASFLSITIFVFVLVSRMAQTECHPHPDQTGSGCACRPRLCGKPATTPNPDLGSPNDVSEPEPDQIDKPCLKRTSEIILISTFSLLLILAITSVIAALYFILKKMNQLALTQNQSVPNAEICLDPAWGSLAVIAGPSLPRNRLALEPQPPSFQKRPGDDDPPSYAQAIAEREKSEWMESNRARKKRVFSI